MPQDIRGEIIVLEKTETYTGISRNPTDNTSGIPRCPHGIAESEFPCLDKCYRKNPSNPSGYEALCPHCRIWLNYRMGTLKVTRVFDCAIRK